MPCGCPSHLSMRLEALSNSSKSHGNPESMQQTSFHQADGHIHWDSNVKSAPLRPHSHRSPPPKPALNADIEDENNEIPDLSLAQRMEQPPPTYSASGPRAHPLADLDDRLERGRTRTRPNSPCTFGNGSNGTFDVERGYLSPKDNVVGGTFRGQKFRPARPNRSDWIKLVACISILVLIVVGVWYAKP